MSSESKEHKKKLPKTFICADGVSRNGSGQCFPLGSKQANNIPKVQQTKCSVFPDEKCQVREKYIKRMKKILVKKERIMLNMYIIIEKNEAEGEHLFNDYFDMTKLEE